MMTPNVHWKLWELPVMYGPRKPVNGRRAERPELRVLEAVAPSTRNRRRRAGGDTLTRLLSCKPLDVELRRLQRAAARSKARLKNKTVKP
jgi:hypothetical protein